MKFHEMEMLAKLEYGLFLSHSLILFHSSQFCQTVNLHVVCVNVFVRQDDFLLIHYDKGPCRNKLGHSRASVIWHRTQVTNASFSSLSLSPPSLTPSLSMWPYTCRGPASHSGTWYYYIHVLHKKYKIKQQFSNDKCSFCYFPQMTVQTRPVLRFKLMADADSVVQFPNFSSIFSYSRIIYSRGATSLCPTYLLFCQH